MRYALRKLVVFVPILLVVVTAAFLLLVLLPGGPAIASGVTTKDGIAKFNHTHGLDKPLLVQYGHYLGGLFSGQLGRSYQNAQPVAEALRQRLPVTLELLVLSQLLALFVALPLGVLSAWRPNSLIDRIAATTTFGLLAAPQFVVAVGLVFAFAVHWHLFPATGYTYLTASVGKNLRSVALPVIVLTLPELAAYLRLLRADMIATLQQDYITMARAKGLSTPYILLRHALRPSSFSVLTVAGLNVGRLIAGAVIVEHLFALPGIGELTIRSIFARDYSVVQGAVLVVAVGYLVINLMVDLLYAVLDPRVRHGSLA